MSTLLKRVYSRNPYEAPIMYTNYDGGKVHGLKCSCDLCGEKVPSEEIFELEDPVYLCSSCFNYFEDIPEGKIKESVKELLIGNVI